jgi:acyl carrier protein
VNQPELTAEKFVADRFESGARLYRSGDRVRWRSDGNLEFLGRLDDQVKLRGFRIELGDIESAILRSGQVRETVVVVRGEDSDAQLVAYLVADAPGEIVERLKMQLCDQLPVYMHPSVYVLLEALPLSANGKVDKKRLPAPEPLLIEYAPPDTSTEAQLAAIWQDILGLERVSVTADFFDLGGHSLLGTRLINAVKRGLNIELPIRLLFEKSDIRSIAALIDEHELRRRNLAIAQEKTEQVELEW